VARHLHRVFAAFRFFDFTGAIGNYAFDKPIDDTALMFTAS